MSPLPGIFRLCLLVDKPDREFLPIDKIFHRRGKSECERRELDEGSSSWRGKQVPPGRSANRRNDKVWSWATDARDPDTSVTHRENMG